MSIKYMLTNSHTLLFKKKRQNNENPTICKGSEKDKLERSEGGDD